MKQRHQNVKVSVRIFDCTYDRAEFWRTQFTQSRSSFYNEALYLYVNQLRKDYPKFQGGDNEAWGLASKRADERELAEGIKNG